MKQLLPILKNSNYEFINLQYGDTKKERLELDRKFKIIDGFTSFLGSQGILYPKLMTYLVAWGEMLAGITIIIGGLLIKSLPVLSNLLTRLSGAGVIVIMISALIIAHSDWSIFIGERGKILFASEQLFLLTIGLYFFIKGND